MAYDQHPAARRAYWGGSHHPDRDDFSGEVILTRIPLTQGYERNGRYHGIGAPLFRIEGAELNNPIDFYIRAPDRKAAWMEAKRAYPKAKLYNPRRKR